MPQASVRPASLRAVAFLVLALAFAMGAASLALTALVTTGDTGGVLVAASAEPGAPAPAHAWQPDATRDARDVLDGLGTFLAPVGFCVLAWATLASLHEPEAVRLLAAAGAFVAAFVLFGPLQSPVLALIGLADASPLVAGIPGALAFSASIALAVSAAPSRVPVLAAAVAGAAGVTNRALEAWGVVDGGHALPLATGWLAAALYAGALAAAGLVEARRSPGVQARGARG